MKKPHPSSRTTTRPNYRALQKVRAERGLELLHMRRGPRLGHPKLPRRLREALELSDAHEHAKRIDVELHCLVHPDNVSAGETLINAVAAARTQA